MSDYFAGLRDKIGHDLVLAPGVAAIIHDGRSWVLMMRSRGWATWGLPAGAIEPGESPEQAVRREVAEETGLDVEPEALLGAFGGEDFRVVYPNGDRVEYTTLVYRCRVTGGELHPADGEAAELRYVDPADLPERDVVYPDAVYRGERVSPQ